MSEAKTQTESSGSAKAARLEKAAIVLMSIGEENAAKVLKCLSREGLLEVTNAMARLSGVKNETVAAAMQEFFQDYREQSGVHGASRAYLQASLSLALGRNIASSVLNSIYGDAIRPKMERLQWASPKWLADHVMHEHETMQAVFLSFLPPELASAVLSELPESARDAVLMNIARLSDIDSELLAELDHLVDRCLENFGSQSAEVDGKKQAAEILNRLPGNRRQMIELLRTRDEALADAIEAQMYDFFILSRQSETVLTRIIEEIPLEQWTIALKGAEPAVRKAILESMPKRQAQTFEDMMRRSGPVPRSRVEQARAEIMAQVKALADAGEIEVQLYDEATVE